MKTYEKVIIVIGSLSIVFFTIFVVGIIAFVMNNRIDAARARHEIREMERQEEVFKSRDVHVSPINVTFDNESSGILRWEDEFGNDGETMFEIVYRGKYRNIEYTNMEEDEYPLAGNLRSFNNFIYLSE